MELKNQEKEIKDKIVNDIRNIFKNCGNELYYVEFNEIDIYIHLWENESYSTEIFPKLNEYFQKYGKISHTLGNGFIISYYYGDKNE